MPLVTAAPVIVDSTNFSRQFGSQINPMGIFQDGSNLFLAQQYSVPSGGNQPIGVYLVDPATGISTEQDIANHPLCPQPNSAGRSCFFDPVGRVIYILFSIVSGGNTLQIATFSTASKTYTGTSASSAIANGSAPAIYRQSSGQLVMPGATTILRYFTYNSPTWAGPTALGSVSGSPVVYGVLVDSSDSGHLFYRDGSSNLAYALISAGLSLGSPTILESVANWDENDIDQLIWGTSVVAAWTRGVGSFDNTLRVAIGTPLAGASFATYDVDTVPSTGTLQYPTLAIDKNGNLVVFAAWTDYTTSPITDLLLMWTFDGVSSWGSPTLFYDETANPPANSVTPATNQFIHTGAAIQLASGEWLYATALEVKPASTSFCAGHILYTSSSPGPLTLACPVNSTGIIGTPYSGQIIASGGTPPYTYMIL